MLTILIVTAIFLTLGFIAAGSEPFLIISGSTILGAIIGILLAVSLNAVVNVPTLEVVSAPAELVALADKDGTSSRIFVSESTSTNYRAYRVMVRNSDGSLVPELISGDVTINFIEDHTLSAVGSWRTVYRGPDPNSWVKVWLILENESYWIARQEIRVPAGTIRQP